MPHILNRRCEPTGRANARAVTGSVKQSRVRLAAGLLHKRVQDHGGQSNAQEYYREGQRLDQDCRKEK
jgi:hypothetical protein